MHRLRHLTALTLTAFLLSGCGGAVYLANQGIARAGVSGSDQTDMDAGNLAGIMDRYGSVPPETLPITQHALLCDVLLKYAELGRASDCLGSLEARLPSPTTGAEERIRHAIPGKKALLALALGHPEIAASLTETDLSHGGRYVYALASIRAGNNSVARPIADSLRRQFEPAPVYYAASLYAALGDYPAARDALQDPARRLLADYGLSGHSDNFGGQVGSAVFRLDVFDEFDFGVFGKVTLAPAANTYVEYLAAQTFLKTGGYREAERRLDVLLNDPNISVFRDVHWRTLNDRAELAQRAGDDAAAERLLRQAIEVIESIRGSVGAEGARIAIVADKQAPYRRLVDLLEQRGDASGALVYAERAHSRALVELLATRYRFGPAQDANSTGNRLVAQYDRQQGEQALGSLTRGADHNALLTRLIRTRQELAAQAPDLADLVTVQPVDLAQVQSHLGAGEVALVYFPGETSWHVFTISKDRIASHDIPGAVLNQQALAFAVAVRSSQQSWQHASEALYLTAVKPALEGVTATSLLIVPSGVLHYVPFAALGEGDHVLLDRFALRITPNLGLITRSARAVRDGHALVIGNPLSQAPQYTLPFAETEARDVAGQLGGATLLIGPDATVAQFITLAPSVDLIHFAGHGVFDQKHPLDSGLLFGRGGRTIDILSARQLYDLRTSASLAFLSACETGVNSFADGEDLMGLERGFFSSGVTTVIASLWEVSDQSTATLAHEFYRGLKQGLPPARALQAAQITVRRQFPNPADWGAFVMASAGAN